MQGGTNSYFDNTLFSESRSNTLRGSLLAVMNVEIRPGIKDKIFIHQMDNELDLAQTFISRHSLPEKALTILLKQIQANKVAVKDSLSPKPPDSTPVSHRNRSQNSSSQETPKKDLQDFEMSGSNTDWKAESIPLARSRSSTDVTNRLYNEQLMKTKYLADLERRTLQKMERLKKEMGSHQPCINSISNTLASNRKNEKHIEDHLQQLGTQVTQRRERAASLQAKQETDHPFKPTLNKVTNKLTKNRPQPTFSKGLKKETINNQLGSDLFKPSMNRMSRDIMENKAGFLDRQKNYEESRQMKINKQHRQKNKSQMVDPVTGKQFFHPTGSSYKPKVWNQNDLVVGDYLYNKGRIKPSYQFQPQKPSINRNSEALVRNLQTKRTIWIFGELDSDQDGLISSHNINIESIPDSILEIIMPILFEMEEFNFELNLEEFKQALETLHKSLTTAQKSILYDYSRKKEN